ncbi:MAG TPA: TetR/AcrR family transcriptional regulator [Candidatus Binatia bacterium]|nr:TetR/AcrR family transcriptional regulator [Candidatus Binatia bacterium]
MAPRTYNLGRRAEAATATRERILEAALALYHERGVAATTLAEVARRADVSRGTILHHFGSADGLLDAVLNQVVTGLDYPDERVQAGAATQDERIRRYVDAMFRFYVRSEADWPAFSRDLDHPVVKAREAEYYATVGRLFAATFGDLASDRVVGAAVRAFVNYMPLHDLRAAGLSLDESIDVVARTLIALVRQRRAAGADSPPKDAEQASKERA